MSISNSGASRLRPHCSGVAQRTERLRLLIGGNPRPEQVVGSSPTAALDPLPRCSRPRCRLSSSYPTWSYSTSPFWRLRRMDHSRKGLSEIVGDPCCAAVLDHPRTPAIGWVWRTEGACRK